MLRIWLGRKFVVFSTGSLWIQDFVSHVTKVYDIFWKVTFSTLFSIEFVFRLRILNDLTLKLKRGKSDIHFFCWCKKDVQIAKKISTVYEDSAVAESTVHNWFAMSESDDFYLEDRQRSSSRHWWWPIWNVD